jgi:hypothetical protein
MNNQELAKELQRRGDEWEERAKSAYGDNSISSDEENVMWVYSATLHSASLIVLADG